jgi:integrase
MSADKAEQKSLWIKTPVANLVRYEPSGIYFARAKVGGKLIRQSLKTKVLSVAKLKLADLLKNEHQKQERSKVIAGGKMAFGDACKTYITRMESNPDIKPNTKKYKKEILVALNKSWPELEQLDIRKITKSDCLNWRAKFAQDYAGTRINAAISFLKHVIEIGVENGLRYDNPAKLIPRAKVRLKHLALPEPEQFEKLVQEIQKAGGGTSHDCADLVSFLAFGGFRISEAAQIVWADCDFKKGEILVRGDKETGTKNWGVRRVPMISEMKHLLEKIRSERENESSETGVMRVHECQKALNRAANRVGVTRITHHDLRHLFATRCIESGVDIPTVSRWMGHKDGGALAMKVYGHLRDQHSASMAKLVSFTSNSTVSPTPQQETKPA